MVYESGARELSTYTVKEQMSVRCNACALSMYMVHVAFDAWPRVSTARMFKRSPESKYSSSALSL